MSESAATRAADAYVSILLNEETYALPAVAVQEVIRWTPLTRVPREHPCVRGVLNLRGRIVPVLDLRELLGLPDVERTDRACIVVVTTERGGHQQYAGLIVDTAIEVVRIPPSSVDRNGAAGVALTSDYVTGVARTGNGLTILLDTRRLIDDGFATTTRSRDPA